jgi:hypothetical protein
MDVYDYPEYLPPSAVAFYGGGEWLNPKSDQGYNVPAGYAPVVGAGRMAAFFGTIGYHFTRVPVEPCFLPIYL